MWAAIFAFIFAVVVEVMCDACRRLAARLVEWSARIIYADNHDRALVRAREWKAMVAEAPKFVALIKSLPFFGVAVGKVSAGYYRRQRHSLVVDVRLVKTFQHVAHLVRLMEAEEASRDGRRDG